VVARRNDSSAPQAWLEELQPRLSRPDRQNRERTTSQSQGVGTYPGCYELEYIRKYLSKYVRVQAPGTQTKPTMDQPEPGAPTPPPGSRR
jgi:hypothetical protein